MTVSPAEPSAQPPALPPALVELAAECGVATSYTDAHGVHRDVPERTVRAVLAAIGVGAHDHDDDDNAIIYADAAALEDVRLTPWRRVLSPTVIATQGSAVDVPVHVPQGATVTVTAHLEEHAPQAPKPASAPDAAGPTEPVVLEPLSGDRIQKVVDGVPMEQITVRVPADLPAGWHRMVVVVVAPGLASTATNSNDTTSTYGTDTGSGSGSSSRPSSTVEATLLVAPASVPIPAGLDSRRAVGLAAQLYQVRSAASWGVGDLGDLAELAEWGAHEFGADFVLVNPMHAGEPFPPVEPSPYLPTTRRFASPLYLRPELVPEYARLAEPDRTRVGELASSTRTGTDAGAGAGADTIDRNVSWAAKLEALRLIFAVPLDPERRDAFESFTREQGPGLRAFATWCALAGEFGPDWARWPAELQDPESEAVSAYADSHPDEIRFHEWLQWLTLEQRAHAQQTARHAGMRLGVLHDLAVGVHPTGADAWSMTRSLARGVSVGAPPDIYNQRGQDWSQPPLRPDALAADGYRAFRDIVRAALRDAGGVRIDHILGLFRLWWIPAGASPTEGTYVHYDHDAMLAVLTLEATRAGAVVVGEDLGTVAPGVRETLTDRGILGTSVMWFEQESIPGDDDASSRSRPVDPSEYRRMCMASVTTHDLVPTAGYADLVHVDIRDRLGQLTRDVEDERRDAEAEVSGFVEEVRERGLLRDTARDVDLLELVAALHAFTASAPSLLFAVSVADLVGDRRPVNMPGTSTEHPNWSVPITDSDGTIMGLEELMAHPGPRKVFDAIHRERR